MSKSPSLRRIQADVRELQLEPSDQYHAAPLEHDMFEWHFTIRGPPATDFEGGIYHGRILLPPDYPFKPPHIMFLTPSGRFETNTKICLSFSAYHPELWQPAWGIRLILEALISFLDTPADGAIGALDWSSAERKRLAKASQTWSCPHCGKIADLLLSEEDMKKKPRAASSSRFAKEIQELQRLQMQDHAKKDDEKESTDKEEDGDKKQQAEGDAEESKAEPEDAETTTPSEQDEEGKDDIETPDKEEEAPPVDDDDDEPKAPTNNNNDASAEENSSNNVDDNAVIEPVPDLTRAAHRSQRQRQQPMAQQPRSSSSGMGWLVDPLLHLIIAVLSAIAFLLLRKIQALAADLQALEEA